MKKMSFSKVMSMIAMFSLTSGFIACSSDNKDDVTNNDPTVESESLNVCPDGNHPHLIDLGLPSGKKWCCCNIGANNPEGYGKYFAWGETEGDKANKKFTWSNYKWCNGTQYTLTKYCSDSRYLASGTTPDNKTELDLDDDAAYASNNNYCMPTSANIKELLDNTTLRWIVGNGVKGAIFKSKLNGNSIFLPASGYCGEKEYSKGEVGFYWSSSVDSYSSDLAKSHFYVSKDNTVMRSESRYYGMSVRAVGK